MAAQGMRWLNLMAQNAVGTSLATEKYLPPRGGGYP